MCILKVFDIASMDGSDHSPVQNSGGDETQFDASYTCTCTWTNLYIYIYVQNVHCKHVMYNFLPSLTAWEIYIKAHR